MSDTDKPKKAGTPANAPKPLPNFDAAMRSLRKKNKSAPKANSEGAQPEQTPSAELPKHRETFNEVVQAKLMRRNVFSSLCMVSELLKHSYTPDSLNISKLGFNQENLHDLMQAVFSTHKGRVFKETEMLALYKEWRDPTVEIIYGNLLGLDKGSSREDMEQRIDALVSETEQLEQLLRYVPTNFVTQLLVTCEELDDPEKREHIIEALGPEASAEALTVEQIRNNVRRVCANQQESVEADLVLDALKLDAPIAPLTKEQLRQKLIEHFRIDVKKVEFDEDAIKKMMKAVESGKNARTDVDDFCSRNVGKFLPTLLTLDRLQQAFAASDAEYKAYYQNQQFNCASREDVVKALNAKFPNQLMGKELEMTAIDPNNNQTADMLKKIVARFDIREDGKLEVVLDRLHTAIKDMYPDALDKNDPVRLEFEKGLTDFSERFCQNSVTEYYPMHFLWRALLDKDGRTYDEELKGEYFGGAELSEVMEQINLKIGVGRAQKIQAAIKHSDDPKVGLIKGIALAYGHREFGEAFVRDVLLVSEAVAKSYEKIRPPKPEPTPEPK